ncbi:MAG: shikimate kinase [Dissulfurimicrobium sp.]|uniref:shikimate kinase n=1 Tax=Dissulfurimicrobium sp. TaxID=2022436 RepID=UPI00404A955A
MKMARKVFLTGYRGVGKSSIGRALALALGWTFWDMDERISSEEGLSIREMVERRGWGYFRERERKVLMDAADYEGNLVAACGGGAVMHEDIWPAVKKNAVVIWLKAGIRTIFERIEADSATAVLRPALTDRPMEEEIRQVLDVRAPLYERWADISIDTDGRSQNEITCEIMDMLHRQT